MHRFLVASILSLAVVLPSLAQKGCPILNGKYSMVEHRGRRPYMRHWLALQTRQEKGRTSYTYDLEGNFQLADGLWMSDIVRGISVKRRMECQAGSLVVDTRATD